MGVILAHETLREVQKLCDASPSPQAVQGGRGRNLGQPAEQNKWAGLLWGGEPEGREGNTVHMARGTSSDVEVDVPNSNYVHVCSRAVLATLRYPSAGGDTSLAG